MSSNTIWVDRFRQIHADHLYNFLPELFRAWRCFPYFLALGQNFWTLLHSSEYLAIWGVPVKLMIHYKQITVFSEKKKTFEATRVHIFKQNNFWPSFVMSAGGRGEESQSNATGAGGLKHAQLRQIFCFLGELSPIDDHLAAENGVQNHGMSHHCDGSNW